MGVPGFARKKKPERAGPGPPCRPQGARKRVGESCAALGTASTFGGLSLADQQLIKMVACQFGEPRHAAPKYVISVCFFRLHFRDGQRKTNSQRSRHGHTDNRKGGSSPV